MYMIKRLFRSDYFCKENILFYLLNVVYYGCTSIYFGFLIMFLTEKGYTSLQCAFFNTIVSIASLIIQPLVGYITDTYIPIKKYLCIASIISIIFTFSLPLTVNNIFLSVICIFFMAGVINPCAFLIDTWAVTLREENINIDYGKNRSGGSVGYFAVSLIAGELIAPFGYNTLYFIHMILFGFVLIILLQIPSIPCKNKGKKVSEEKDDLKQQKAYTFWQILKMLFKNYEYCIFIISAIFYSIGLRAMSSNVTFKLLDLGGIDSQMGIALAVGAIFEVPFLFIINFCIHKFKLSYLYIASMFFIVLRGVLMATAQSILVLYISQILQACSYGIYVAVSLEIVNRVVSRNILTTSITLMVAMTSGLAAIIGILLSGFLIDSFGVNTMCWIVTFSSFIGLVVYLFYCIKKTKLSKESIL